MKIEDGKIKPCSTCLRLRQQAKDLLIPRKRFTLVETTVGDLTIDNTTRKITAVSLPEWGNFLGLEVYVAGRGIIDIKQAQYVPTFGEVLKTSKTD